MLEDDRLKQDLYTSINSTTTGRRIGFRVAQQRVAQLVLDEIKDVALSMRIYNLVMELKDK